MQNSDLYKKVKDLKDSKLEDSDVVVKLSESNLSITEIYKCLKEYNQRQKDNQEDSEFFSKLGSYAPVDKYGIPMLMPGEEW